VYQLCHFIKDNEVIDIGSDEIKISDSYSRECWFNGSIFLNGKDAPTFDSWRVVNVPQKNDKQNNQHYLIIMKQYKHMSIFVDDQKSAEYKEKKRKKFSITFKKVFLESYDDSMKTFNEIVTKRGNKKEKWSSLFIFHTNWPLGFEALPKWLPENTLIYVETNLRLFYSDIFMWRTSPRVLKTIQYEEEEDKGKEKVEIYIEPAVEQPKKEITKNK